MGASGYVTAVKRGLCKTQIFAPKIEANEINESGDAKLCAKARRMTAYGAEPPPEDAFVAAAIWGSADPIERSVRDAG